MEGNNAFVKKEENMSAEDIENRTGDEGFVAPETGGLKPEKIILREKTLEE